MGLVWDLGMGSVGTAHSLYERDQGYDRCKLFLSEALDHLMARLHNAKLKH